MGIGSITSTSSMSSMQMNTTGSTDSKSKKVEDEITIAQQQLQKLSSKEELSVAEKNNERQKIQKEISSLNTELKQHQEELSRSQKREAMMAELLEDTKPANEEKSEDKIQTNEISSEKSDEKSLPANEQQTGQQGNVIVKNDDGTVILKDSTKQADETKENDTAEKETKTTDRDKTTDTGMTSKEAHAMISADSSVQQAGRQGTIVAKTRDGIAILKGEMRQDEKRGIDTEKNQAELEKMEKKENRAMAFQFSTLGEASNAMKSAETNTIGTKDNTLIGAGNNGFSNPFINALNVTQQNEGWASQQMFHVSLGH